jgi:DNA-binding response OmpR family regulator
MNILIADDDLVCREYMRGLFGKWPEHQVTLAEDGREAWAILDDPKRWFDVAMLDVGMPHLSGLDLLKRLRESGLHRSLDIVMCTARNDRDTITAVIGLGAKHYLIKPCTEPVIAAKLKQIAEKRLAEAR